MEGFSDFTQNLVASGGIPEKSDRENLDVFLEQYGWDEPDLKPIAFAFQKLIHHLHHQIYQLIASKVTALPRLYAIPTGSLMMGLPSSSPCKILVLGNISENNYHDLVWEAIEEVKKHTQLPVGVLEMQKFPVLRFSLMFEGFVFDLKYHQVR